MIRTFIKKPLNNQLSKFIIVGLSNTIISYIVFFVFYNFILISNAFSSQGISYAAGIFWSFFWNRKWTFSEKNHSLKTFIPFFIVQITLLFISAFSMSYATQHLSWNVNYIWFFVMAIITIINFVLSKFIVFKV